MRFLFTTIPGSGHFHPLVPTARALRRRGHDVAFATSPTFAPAIEAAGFEAHPAGPAWLESYGDPVMQKILAGELFVDLVRMGMVEGVIRAANGDPGRCHRPRKRRAGWSRRRRHPRPARGLRGSRRRQGLWPMIRPGVARAAAEHGLDGER